MTALLVDDLLKALPFLSVEGGVIDSGVKGR